MQAPRVAEMSVGVGETYDLEVDATMVAARGPVWLEVVTRYYPGYRFTFKHEARVPVVVDTRTATRR